MITELFDTLDNLIVDHGTFSETLRELIENDILIEHQSGYDTWEYTHDYYEEDGLLSLIAETAIAHGVVVTDDQAKDYLQKTISHYCKEEHEQWYEDQLIESFYPDLEYYWA